MRFYKIYSSKSFFIDTTITGFEPEIVGLAIMFYSKHIFLHFVQKKI